MDIRDQEIIKTDQHYPSLVRRIQSIFIDTLVIILSMVVFAGILSNFNETPDWVRGVLLIGLFCVYEPLLMSLGGTVGNRIMNIQVRNHIDEKGKINIFKAYVR